MKKVVFGVIAVLLVVTAGVFAINGNFRGKNDPDDAYYAKLENEKAGQTYTIKATNPAGHQIDFMLDSNFITEDMFDEDGCVKILVNKHDEILEVVNIAEDEYIEPAA